LNHTDRFALQRAVDTALNLHIETIQVNVRYDAMITGSISTLSLHSGSEQQQSFATTM
jgi:hypothetical protein